MTHSMAQALDDFAPALPLLVAFSGGADSTALLFACAQKWPGQVRAVHVHHGLQAAADAFALHCAQICRQLGVPFRLQKVQAQARPGQSPEDAARKQRYSAIDQAADAAGTPSIALAHHADDQVETVLLALSRGAGLAGLSAMPYSWLRAGRCYYRPLLSVAGSELRSWLAQQGVDFVTDPSNAEQRFTRNRIRAQLLPVLEACQPAFRTTFARSAAHAAQAQALLLEVGAEDLALVGAPPNIKLLQSLSQPRLANVLRHWLRSCHHTAPSTAQLAELMRQLAACRSRSCGLHLKVGSGYCRRLGACLHWYNP